MLDLILTHEPQRLFDLREDWLRLQQNSHARGPALTWQAMSTWYRHFGQIGRLWLIEAREAGRLIGLAPLIVLRVQPKYGLAWRQMEFISAHHSQEHLDFLIEPGYEMRTLSAFIELLFQCKSEWDVLHLSALADTRTLDFLKGSGLKWESNPDREMIAPYIPLPDTAEAYLSTLSSNRRWKLRSYRRKLDEQYPGNWSIDRVEDVATLAAAFERLVTLHQAKWVLREKEGAFGRPGLREYFLDLMGVMLQEGWLRLYQLKVNGQVPVVLFSYHYRGRAYNHIVGLDESITDIPVGHVMTLHSITTAIEEGLTEYSMMWGQEPYKYSFGVQDRIQHAFDLVHNPRVVIQRTGVNVLRSLKQRIRPAQEA